MNSFKCSILKEFGTNLNLASFLYNVLYTLFTYIKNPLWSHAMPGTGTFSHMDSIKCSILKVFRTYLLILSFLLKVLMSCYLFRSQFVARTSKVL